MNAFYEQLQSGPQAESFGDFLNFSPIKFHPKKAPASTKSEKAINVCMVKRHLD